MGEGSESFDEQDAGMDWRHLGSFGPRVAPGASPPRRDLGPGGSLLAEARRARATSMAARPRLTRPRVLFGASTGVGLLAVVLLAAVGGVAGVVAGVLVVLLAATGVVAGVRMWLEQTTAEARLTERARTEQRLAAELETLTASGWVLLHDRVLPGGNHRVAHLAVGPAGVFVVTPLPSGPLSMVGHQVDEEDYRELYAGSLHLGSWLRTRRWEVEQLEPAIANALEDTVWTGPTVPVVVQLPPPRWWPRRRAADTQVPEMPPTWSGVEVRPLSAVAETLRGLPSPLSRTAVASLATSIGRLCPPAGLDDQDSVSNKPG